MTIKERLHVKLKKFGFLLAIIGLIPIRSGVLLLQEKDCGCFLIEKTTLYTHNILFGSLSLVVGIALVILGILVYEEVKISVTKGWIFIFLLVSGVIGYSAGIIQESEKVGEDNYDDLTKALTEKGWIFFYANWCSHCHDQVDTLGSSVKNLRMIDCTTIQCPTFVQGYPTWAKMNDEGSIVDVKSGFQSTEKLEEMAK